MSNENWPDELFDADEWPDLVKKPDAIYFTGGTVFVDGVKIGECGETELVPKLELPDPEP